MASKQLMLARQPIPNPASKAARQAVAPFPQKLYEMVNEPATDNLIRWAEDGNSFYVLDQERFSGEVLGRWFKHRNFSSFVRQLNMYAFHKIPQLQQGVLKAATDTEIWQFEHEHFRRGHPELVHLIQRKKTLASASEDATNAAALALLTASLGGGAISHEVASPQQQSASAPPAIAGAHTSGELLDPQQLINGITAIKRHQVAISTELAELKESNRQLWQEAIAARERHKKHQDTINRILKFLAGVFAGGASPGGEHHGDPDRHSPPVVPRKRQRLMISDGSDAKSKTPINDQAAKETTENRYPMNLVPPSPERFAAIETPSPSIAPSEMFSPLPADPPALHLNAKTEKPVTPPLPPPPSASQPASTTPTTTALLPAAPSHDQNLQAVFNEMLQSPDQIQRLLHAFSVQQQTPYNFVPASGANEVPVPSPDLSQIGPWDNTALALEQPQPRQQVDANGSLIPSSPRIADYLEASRRMYNSTDEIEHAVDALSRSLEGFIESCRLDQDAFTAPVDEQAPPPPQHLAIAGDAEMDDPQPQPDFDFDAFLHDIQTSAPDAPTVDSFVANQLNANGPGSETNEELTAILDEVASQASDGTHSPINTAARRASGRKRKSDTAQLSPRDTSVISAIAGNGGGAIRPGRRK